VQKLKEQEKKDKKNKTRSKRPRKKKENQNLCSSPLKAQQKRSLQVTEKVKKATLFPQQQNTTTVGIFFFYHAPLTLVTTKAMMTMAMMMSTIWYSWHHGLERFSRVEEGVWGSRRKGNRGEGQGGDPSGFGGGPFRRYLCAWVPK
jgi:uncharacterized membrane protein YgcG